MRGKRNLLLSSIVVLLVLAFTAIGVHYWYEHTYYVLTDDAIITGDFVKVIPMTSGELLTFNVKEGDFISKNELLGYIEANSAASNIRAPISGTIVKVGAHVGEYVSSTELSTLALIIDPNSIYITANIEETEVSKVEQGQSVDVTVDEYGSKKFTGTVVSIGQASGSDSTNTQGSINYVVQRVPVKIKFNKTDAKLLPGTDATVKIHIK